MNDHIYKWELLHGSAKHIRQAIITEWESLLSNNALKEEAYQEYLAEHAGFFFCDTSRHLVAISKLRLGSDFVTDFVVPSDNRSMGWRYEFIEIESPHSPPFTQAGKPSARLVNALNQIVSWKAWLSKHSNEIKHLLGNTVTLHNSITYTIYIGTRKNTIKSLAMRNQWANENNVSIRSFDSLAENVSKRYCAEFFEGFSNESEQLSSSILNQLANPFVSAYTDREWRGITQDGRFQSGAHMVALNANLLTHSHKYSNKHSEFLSFDNVHPA